MSEKSRKHEGLKGLAFPKPGDEVVISGIAGRFPDSDNVQCLQENLFNKVDLVTEDNRRWNLEHPEIPRRMGKVNRVEKFDAEFFGITVMQAHTMDPQARMMMEHGVEAVIDAGVNPRKLRGTRTGVFIGSCVFESEKTWVYTEQKTDGHGITGSSRGMMANRLSRWLGCKGPSYTVDTACSSSLTALDHAYRAIRTGECDAALVGGSNLCLHPNISRQFFRLGVLSLDGRCKSFDDSGNGYCRGEAISMIYLQKAKDAKRVYAHVVHMKTNSDGFKEEGITFPSNTAQRTLLEQFYKECNVPPSSLTFLEAHGTGTSAGDPVELDAIDGVFSPGRTTPLQIGSVKSNLGHCEPASGLCSIAKVVIAMETGYIAPNLHYKRPRRGVEALEKGRIQVVTEPTPWEGGYVGINSFGFGGSNAHVLLKSNPKEKVNDGRPSDDMPRLVVVSGRTREAVTTLLDYLESRPVDVEYISLLHDLHSEEIPGHPYRGYTILPPLGLPRKTVRDVQRYPARKRPVCFSFTGVGCLWPGMGTDLLKIPAFAKVVKKCDKVLKVHGVDVVDILTNEDPRIFRNTLNAFVGTAVMQIGLVDVLASIGIVPDKIIGHSVGELGCAYADGCFTAEQTVRAAYSLGLALIDTDLIHESTADIRIQNRGLRNECLADIERRKSHVNGYENIKSSDSKLQGEGITASGERRVVAGSTVFICLQQIIQNPKVRSEKWLTKANTAQLSLPEYLANAFLDSMLFESTRHSIPTGAIIIEIPSRDLMQKTPRNATEGRLTDISLTKLGHNNSMEVLLQAIGEMYEAGLHPQLTNLYPRVQYPVSRGTPMISPLLRWQHSEHWIVIAYQMQQKIDTGERDITISLNDEVFDWMAGHVIDGRILLPATGYLVLVWETVGMMHGKLYEEIPVVFEDVRFHRATTIPKEGSITLTVMVQKGSGRFEVFEGGSTVVTGSVRVVANPDNEYIDAKMSIDDDDEELHLSQRDIYKELRLRGYHYAGLFRGLEGASLRGTKARIAWKNNWVAFMDNMLQMKMLGIGTRGLLVPTGIQKIVIDPEEHLRQLRSMPDDDQVFTVRFYKNLDVIVSGGVEIREPKATAIARKEPAGDPVLENLKFVAHRDCAEMALKDVARVATHLALENQSSVTITVIEFIDKADDIPPDELTSPLILDILGDLPLLQADVNIVAPDNKFPANTLPPSIQIINSKKLGNESRALLAVGHGLFSVQNTENLKFLQSALKDGGFLMSREPLNADTSIRSTLENESFDLVLKKHTSKECVIVVRKRRELSKIATVIQVSNHEFAWIPIVQAALRRENEKRVRDRRRVLLVSEGDFESGLLGLVNCLRKEPGGEVVQGLLIQDSKAPRFSLENPFYYEQLNLGLALNVLRPGKSWGSYQFFAINLLALKPVYHVRMDQCTRGDLSSMKWVEGPIQPNYEHKDIIRINYSSINFRDVMMTTGKLAIDVSNARLSQNQVTGFEFSGRDRNGRAFMGMIRYGAFANMCVCDRQLLWEVPNHWTLEDAATIPVVYGTAYYALFLRGKMTKEDKVLIHAGSGGVGQAAITLALHEGCEVFTTVGTPEKREFIRKQFPQIDDDHIGNSRDTSFEQLILRKTRGRGVDIVLNSLAEEKLQASVRCLAKGGRFLEIGKYDLAANNNVGLESFLKGITFHGIFLDNLFAATEERKRELTTILDEGIKSGAVKPLVRTVFAMDQSEEAFRYMAAGKHIGKVIIKVRDEDDLDEPRLPLALPRYYCLEGRSYVILGGLGGFGLELADWLVLRGARKLVLTSRRGVSTGYQRMRVNIWESYGVRVVISVGKDASTPEGCEAILKEAAALGPVDAIFNLAVVLRDALFENQTAETFEESFRAKAWATKQLDVLSRKLCPHLRQFVIFSSVSCGRGNAGQTNYGMANSIMERICEARAAENLPGLAIEWGAIGDVGLVAEMQENDKELVIGGTLQQRISSCLQKLDGFLQQNASVVSSMVVAEKKAGSAGARNIVDAVVNIMGIKDIKTVSMHTPLAELGMDSMMAVEIKQTLEREYEVFLTPADIRSLNFMKLAELSQEKDADDDTRDNAAPNVTKNFGGLEILIQTLGTAEIIRDICVPLATGSEIGRKEVFILPGIEGTCTVFKPLIDKLKSPTTCLQLGSVNFASVNDMAEYLIPHIKARSQSYRNSVVAGYSFGSLVAIEIVRRLEYEGFSGRLVLIDGSPDYLKTLILQSFNTDNDDNIQRQLLLKMTDMVDPSAVTQLVEDLESCNSWEERLEAFIKNVPEDTNLNFTREDQRSFCSSTFNRFKAIQHYETSTRLPLRTPITLLKPRTPSVGSMTEDYGLSSITEGKVDVYYATGNHLTMLNDDICAAAIDGELIQNERDEVQ